MRWIGLVAASVLALSGCAQRSAWTLPVQPASAEQLLRDAPTGRLPRRAGP